MEAVACVCVCVCVCMRWGIFFPARLTKQITNSGVCGLGRNAVLLFLFCSVGVLGFVRDVLRFVAREVVLADVGLCSGFGCLVELYAGFGGPVM